MSMSNSENPLKNALRGSLERVSSPNLDEKTGNHAVSKKNIDHPLDKVDSAEVEKKIKPAKVKNDHFTTKGTPDLKVDTNSVEFISSNQAQDGTKSSYDIFKNAEGKLRPLSPEEMEGRDVLNLLGFNESEREAENPFSVAASADYETGEANHTDFYAQSDKDTAKELSVEREIELAVKKSIGDSWQA